MPLRRTAQRLPFLAQRLFNQCAAFRKRCDAGAGRIGYPPIVNKEALAVLESRLPLIKGHWLPRLFDEPSGSPLGRHATVEFLIDTTLMQLLRGLQPVDGVRWLERCNPTVAPLHCYLGCGLGKVIKYFSTGEESLRAGAAEAMGVEFEEALAAFRLLARHEVDVLCGACRHARGADCELKKAYLDQITLLR